MAVLRLTCLLLALLVGARSAAAPLPVPAGGTVLLVIAPHPDDETLCCAGAIQQVLAAGGQAAILWVTSGDGSVLGALFEGHNPLRPQSMLELGARRMLEARAAATALGVSPDRQLFLGYPDGSLLYLLDEPQSVQRSPLTHARAVPYRTAAFPGDLYQGLALRRDFAAALERLQPTLVLAPSILDTHPDHRAAGRLARDWAAAHPGHELRLWIVHGGEGWPAPRTLLPALPLTPPPVARQLSWQALALTPAEETRKRRALEAHASQMRVMAPFLLAFVRSNELYAGEDVVTGDAAACSSCAAASAGVSHPERTPQTKNASPPSATTPRSQPHGR